MSLSSLTGLLLGRASLAAIPSAAWVAVAPADKSDAEWRVFRMAGEPQASPADHVQGSLEAVARYLPDGAAVAVIVPLSRCIVMAVDLPPLQGVKLQQALSSEMGDRLIGGTQHYATAPLEQERIREVAACDALWFRRCLDELLVSGLRVVQVIPEAVLLPRCAAWWGALQAGQDSAWLVRAANGEAVRVAPAQLNAVLLDGNDTQRAAWQWFADPVCGAPPLDPSIRYSPLPAATLVHGAVTGPARWDLRQFAFVPPDGAAQFMAWCSSLVRQRSGRFALTAIVALLVVNLAGLNLYAMKQQRAIKARHVEMERIVTQALPDVPRLLEPAVQLEAAWQRVRTGSGASDATRLLSLFAQTGNATGVTALEISERVLRATFADTAALDRAWTACQSAPMRESLQRFGVRCARDGTRLVLDFARQSTAADESLVRRRAQC